MNRKDFYAEATSRNIGVITEREQGTLRRARVAIAGMGAVGGHYALALARLGVENFTIADGDEFEPVNMHRQAGAFMGTLGRSKADVMGEMIRQINPDAQVRVIPRFVTESNVDEFLKGADVVLDGIDFFQIDARRLLFRKAREGGIPAVTCGPIGYGAALLTFMPHGMSFEGYFGLRAGMTRAERLACFLVGLLPPLARQRHPIDRNRIDVRAEKGPALISSIMLCAGIVTTEVIRILLQPDEVRCAPHLFYLDSSGRRFRHAFARRGRTGWLDRLGRWLAFRAYPSLREMHEEEKGAMPLAQRADCGM